MKHVRASCFFRSFSTVDVPAYRFHNAWLPVYPDGQSHLYVPNWFTHLPALHRLDESSHSRSSNTKMDKEKIFLANFLLFYNNIQCAKLLSTKLSAGFLVYYQESRKIICPDMGVLSAPRAGRYRAGSRVGKWKVKILFKWVFFSVYSVCFSSSLSWNNILMSTHT